MGIFENIANLHRSYRGARAHTATRTSVDIHRKEGTFFVPYDREHVREVLRNQHITDVERVGRYNVFTTREGYKAMTAMPLHRVPYDTGI